MTTTPIATADSPTAVMVALVAPSANATAAGPVLQSGAEPVRSSVSAAPLSVRVAWAGCVQPGVRKRSMIRHVALEGTAACTCSEAADECSASAKTRPLSCNGLPPSVAVQETPNLTVPVVLTALTNVFAALAPPML